MEYEVPDWCMFDAVAIHVWEDAKKMLVQEKTI
jgi:hypothetical protein